jgi:hypothetical protein
MLIDIFIWGERLHYVLGPLKAKMRTVTLKQTLAFIVTRELAVIDGNDFMNSPIYRFLKFLIVAQKDLDLLTAGEVIHYKQMLAAHKELQKKGDQDEIRNAIEVSKIYIVGELLDSIDSRD